VSDVGGGFQARNTPAERRAFFDVQRQLQEILARLDEHDTTLSDHESRLEVLEP